MTCIDFISFTAAKAATTCIDLGASLGRKALISWPDLSSLALRRHEIKRLILPSKSCADLIGVKGISICATDRREDKALTTMPSRLRDKSGHRRKAFLLSVAHKRRSKSSRRRRSTNSPGRDAKPTERAAHQRRSKSSRRRRSTNHTGTRRNADRISDAHKRRSKSSAEHAASKTFRVCHSRQRSQPPQPPKLSKPFKLPQRIKRTFLKIMLAS